MTRYTRLGKSTHQRVAAESSTWDDLKSTPVKKKNSSKSSEFRQKGRGSDRGFKRKSSDAEVSANFTELGPRNADGLTEGNDRKSKNVKGYGKSKVVKIFGQFWVPEDDAKRLQSLVKKLREQGLSRKEILEALQTERRRAEKAAKRIRDKTCFGCRQFGHILSDCPNNGPARVEPNADPADELIEQEPQNTICFKCGTTEHTSRNCKRKGDKFNFAKCFICSKTGHISRQCPENKRGIYPTGGECNICKELTHLAKDCPSSFSKLGTASAIKTQRNEESNLPVMSKVSDPFASTEYEPEYSMNTSSEVKQKKRRVKF